MKSIYNLIDTHQHIGLYGGVVRKMDSVAVSKSSNKNNSQNHRCLLHFMHYRLFASISCN